MPAKSRKPPPPDTERRANDPIVAEYHGADWNHARCAIPKCSYTLTAVNYFAARRAMSDHRSETHA